jgi:hypothetical protein
MLLTAAAAAVVAGCRCTCAEVWVKTPQVLMRDRLMSNYTVKPALARLKRTLLGLGGERSTAGEVAAATAAEAAVVAAAAAVAAALAQLKRKLLGLEGELPFVIYGQRQHWFELKPPVAVASYTHDIVRQVAGPGR